MTVQDIPRPGSHGAAAPHLPAWRDAFRRVRERLLAPQLAAALHPTPLRVRGLDLFMLVGHPLFWVIWAVELPQPYENLPLRLLNAGLGLLLIAGLVSKATRLRHERLAHTVATVGIVAHELRTPLATMALIGDAIRGAAGDCHDTETAQRLEQLAARLHVLVRNMNHHIDMQVTNARPVRMPTQTSPIRASNLVREAVSSYPFRSTRERDCVRVRIQDDFVFRGSPTLFRQVIDNLIKNAMTSLAAATNSTAAGDLVVHVLSSGGLGQIVVTDRGVGIAAAHLPRVFDAFFSTHRGTGHGLGLAFCRQVVSHARGDIRAHSQPGGGAAFTIELPILH